MCMLFGLPGFIQEAAITALEIGAEAESRAREYCAVRQRRLAQGLRGIAMLRPLPPDAGMFMLIDVRGCGLTGHEFMTELFRREGVSVLDGGAFGKGTADFVRLFFGTDETTLREGCRRIRRFTERGW